MEILCLVFCSIALLCFTEMVFSRHRKQATSKCLIQMPWKLESTSSGAARSQLPKIDKRPCCQRRSALHHRYSFRLGDEDSLVLPTKAIYGHIMVCFDPTSGNGVGGGLHAWHAQPLHHSEGFNITLLCHTHAFNRRMERCQSSRHGIFSFRIVILLIPRGFL